MADAGSKLNHSHFHVHDKVSKIKGLRGSRFTFCSLGRPVLFLLDGLLVLFGLFARLPFCIALQLHTNTPLGSML